MSTVAIDGATYTVDNAGNRTAKTDQRTTVATSYGYDSIYQLLSATQGVSTTESYGYDPVGNRLSSLAGSYASNSSNELTSSPTATFTYDNNGNTLSKTDSTGATSYAWDLNSMRAARSASSGFMPDRAFSSISSERWAFNSAAISRSSCSLCVTLRSKLVAR
jgi:YD repeat-containing protein